MIDERMSRSDKWKVTDELISRLQSSEMWRHTPENSNIYVCRRENPKSQKLISDLLKTVEFWSVTANNVFSAVLLH
jgi:hypothetical protein